MLGIKIFSLFMILHLLAGVSPCQTGSIADDRLKLISADSLVGKDPNGRSVKELWGNVEFEQGNARMKCQRAEWIDKEDQIWLFGNVIIFDGKRTLSGDRVHYDGIARRETAWGNVVLESGTRRLVTNQMIYQQEDETAFAENSVRFEDFIEKVILTGHKAVYYRNGDHGIIEGHPLLVKTDTLTHEEMKVSGKRMEAWGEEQKVLIQDSVVIEKGKIRAFCHRAQYDGKSESLQLDIVPVVWYDRQEMSGDSILIKLNGVFFEGSLINGKGMIVSRDSTFEDILKGKRIEIIAERDTIKKVILDGQASGSFHLFDEDNRYIGENAVTGDRLTLIFVEDRINRVIVISNPGQSTGEYHPSGTDEDKKQQPKENGKI